MRGERRRHVGHIACVALALTLFAGIGAAHAQDTDATSARAARALFTEGVALADAGQWSEAVARFRRALALRESSVIAYNLGVALTREGHPVEATEIFRRVLRSDTTDAELRAEATTSLESAEPQIAWAAVSYPRPTTGLSLHVDGDERPIALLGASVPLDPGAHEITLTRDDGALVGRGAITVEAGAHAELTLSVVEAPVIEAAVDSPEVDVTQIVAPSPPPQDDSGLWIGLGVGGGVVAVTLAIVLVVVLVPPSEAAPYSGSLGTVEIGR